METDEQATRDHCMPATVHGEQRWEAGWSLAEVVRDYQILRLVILDYLEETLERPLDNREVMAIGLALDEAITASIVTYTTSRDKHLRQLEEKRAGLARKVQEFLRSQAEALRESDRRKNEFLATLAHELRNPLAPLGNAVGVLHRHPTNDPIVLQIRDIFDRQVQQMGRLLDDLLDVSRIGQGKVLLQKEAVNLAAVVAQAVQMNEPLLKARQLHFEVVLPKSRGVARSRSGSPGADYCQSGQQCGEIYRARRSCLAHGGTRRHTGGSARPGHRGRYRSRATASHFRSLHAGRMACRPIPGRARHRSRAGAAFGRTACGCNHSLESRPGARQ